MEVNDERPDEFKRALPFDVNTEVRVLKQKVAELEMVCRVLAKSVDDMLLKLSRDELAKAQEQNDMANRAMQMSMPMVDRRPNDDDDGHLSGLL
jgi:hypothetical protein